MSEALFEGFEPDVVEAPPATPDVKWTERMVLNLIHDRYSKVKPGNGPRYVVAEHVRNEGGFGKWDIKHFQRTGRRTTLRTADALAIDLWPSSGHVIHGFEVKVSRGDWLTELADQTKADAFRRYVHHWWLVVPDANIVRGDLPKGWGLLAFDGQALRVKHKAPKLTPEPMPLGMTAAWLRATAKTATRQTTTPAPAARACPDDPADVPGEVSE